IDRSQYMTLSVQSCRGCPFDCEFCDVVALNGRKPRYKSPTQFVSEIEYLHQLGWRGPVFVVDDNFVGDPRRCRDILRELIAWRGRSGSKITFITEASVNMAADAELLELMTQAGFKKVFLAWKPPAQPACASAGNCRICAATWPHPSAPSRRLASK
ncbi:MAG: B12-binding domain-containing radical SAM protein, partial [Candidatus Krumholzibacteria bacterium]|nr:B12-binding domain-containing radical SAM protein [Candidatus Krumholzibacteria bacterium]